MDPAITFRTAGPWGVGKGGNLDATEIDENFYNLAQAIGTLAANPLEPVQIAAFSLVGGASMLITMSNGTTVGPLPLPVLSWRWRGDWVPFVPYKALDVFAVEDTGIFLVLIEHTSAASFDPAATDGASNPLYKELFAAPQSTSGAINSALSAGCSMDWGLISGPVSATADWGLISSPVTLHLDMGFIGR